jgi:hypothetical protein
MPYSGQQQLLSNTKYETIPMLLILKSNGIINYLFYYYLDLWQIMWTPHLLVMRKKWTSRC